MLIEQVKVEEPPKDTAMEAEVKAAQQRALIPIEERIQQFKAMLAEKEVVSYFCLVNHSTGNSYL